MKSYLTKSGRFQPQKIAETLKCDDVTSNQGVTGSRPVQPTKAGRPILPGIF